MASTFLNLPTIKQDVDVRDLNPLQDTVGIGDVDGHVLDVNSDGSINVVLNEDSYENSVNVYGEASSVASSLETTLVAKTAIAGVVSYLQRVTVSGTNIADYKIKVNGIVIDRYYTTFGAKTGNSIDFVGTRNLGYRVEVGDIFSVTVEHTRPVAGDFNARLQILEVS